VLFRAKVSFPSQEDARNACISTMYGDGSINEGVQMARELMADPVKAREHTAFPRVPLFERF
jgi:hypothetical protein